MTKTNRFLKEKGIILIEALIALAVVVMVMTALVTALVSSVNSTNFSKDQSLATGYSQEGLEIMRGLKDDDFNNISSRVTNVNGNTYPLGASKNLGDNNKIDNYFTRTVYIVKGMVDARNGKTVCAQAESYFVASTVTWSDSRCTSGGDCHKVELSSCFLNLDNFSL